MHEFNELPFSCTRTCQRSKSFVRILSGELSGELWSDQIGPTGPVVPIVRDSNFERTVDPMGSSFPVFDVFSVALCKVKIISTLTVLK